MENVIKALEYMTIGSTLHDKDGKIIYSNPVFCKMFRVSNKKTINKNINNNYFLKNVNNKKNMDYINNNLQNIHDKIIKVNTYDEKTWIRINSITIKNGLDFYILTYEDISESYNISYLYEHIFNNINTGVIILKSKNGKDFYIKNINPYGCKIDNINDKSKLINKNITSFDLPIIDGHSVLEHIIDLWKTGKKKDFYNCHCKYGDNDNYRNISMIKVETSEIIILFDDITEQIKSKEKLEKSDRYKSIFLSNMSHEIRSPINSIVGFSEMLDEVKNDNEKLEEYIEIIKSSSQSLLKIIDDVLDFSKIEAGKLEISKKNFDINKILEELYITNKNKVKENVNLELITSKRSIKILNDEFRFKQIFNNLLSNSIKFTKNGSISFGYEKDGDLLKFFVKDTGVGIKDKDKEKLFNRFLQSKYSKGNMGHGLGLSIAKELSILMGGNMWFDSEYGKGTNFYFTLPNNRKVGRSKKTKTGNIDMYNTDFNGKAILIVEDIEFNIKLLKSYLNGTNCNIIIAENGNDALIKYNENKNIIDLILMDIQLPEMNGTEVTKIIRTIDTETPIIAQTAYAMKEEIDDIMKFGFDDLIKKPIRKEELIRIINKFI